MLTLKFKAQPINAFFATVNQMFSSSSQLLTTAKVNGNQIVEHSSDNETVLSTIESSKKNLSVEL